MNKLTLSQPLSVPEAAKLKGVCRHTILRWIKLGQLPAARVGKINLIELKDLEEVIRYKPGRPFTWGRKADYAVAAPLLRSETSPTTTEPN